MARKPARRTEMVAFDVIYEDGTQTSNRKVPGTALEGLEGDAQALPFFEAQDRDIAERSGQPRPAIKSIKRSGAK